ncbi:hypothetical protein HpDR24_12080 [Helicobacter pylori]
MRAYYRFKQPKKNAGRGIKRSPFFVIISKENKKQDKTKGANKTITPIGINREQELCFNR